jgi:DNA-binding NarL/FixJ family response regulator
MGAHVLLVDDYVPVRQRAREILLEAHPETVITEAGSAADARRLVVAQTWDVAVIDFNLPDESALDVLGQLARQRPRPRIIVVSALPSFIYEIAARDAGADEFIPKEELDRRLVHAVFD